MPTKPLSPAISIGYIEPAQAEGGVLCLEVGNAKFGFAVLNASDECCLFEEYEFPSLLTKRSTAEMLPTIFQQRSILQTETWREVRISVDSPSFTLIPAALFRKEYASNYLALMRGSVLPPTEVVQFYEHSEGFYSVFSMSQLLKDSLLDQYGMQSVTFVHQTSALLQATTHLGQQAHESQMLLYFENEFVTVMLRDNKTLLFCNRFGYRTAQDLTYYVLYVLDELKLLPTAVTTTLYGEITPFAEAYTELSKFLPNLVFGTLPSNIQLTDAFDDLPEHRYLPFYGLFLMND